MRPQSEFSTFGTFGPSATGPEEEKLDDIREKGHNVAPSISSSIAMNLAGYGANGTTPSAPVASPSEALAASNAPTAVGAPQLHERPKYVFGQGDPDAGNGQPVDGDGAYGSQPYDQNAYGYPGGSGYQDAERAYQTAAAAGGPEGAAAAGGYYDQHGYYYSNSNDPNAYAAGVGQYYDYSQQQQQPGQQYQHHGHTPSQSQAYGGM